MSCPCSGSLVSQEPCRDNDIATVVCPDGSEIVVGICADGRWILTGDECSDIVANERVGFINVGAIASKVIITVAGIGTVIGLLWYLSKKG